MTNKEMQQHINMAAQSARKLFKDTMPKDSKIIEINYRLPYVAVHSGNDEYFFQGQEASELLEQYEVIKDKLTLIHS